jgi:hypothetical protein
MRIQSAPDPARAKDRVPELLRMWLQASMPEAALGRRLRAIGQTVSIPLGSDLPGRFLGRRAITAGHIRDNGGHIERAMAIGVSRPPSAYRKGFASSSGALQCTGSPGSPQVTSGEHVTSVAGPDIALSGSAICFSGAS